VFPRAAARLASCHPGHLAASCINPTASGTAAMRQLALDVRLADHAVFESFHAGPNALAVTTVRSIPETGSPRAIWLHGPHGSGKSHLLQAAVAETHVRGAATAYLPLGLLGRESAGVLEGMESAVLVALDDVGAVAGDAPWESALFRLHERVMTRGGRLLLAAAEPPAHAGFALADLVSRFCAAAVFRLERLGDDDLLSALTKRAAWRGLVLPEDTARFLLARVERDTETLFGLLDRLDCEALAAQRRLTIPFVRSVLGTG